MLEGGGQILRMAAALSALTTTPVEVSNIRAGSACTLPWPVTCQSLQLVLAEPVLRSACCEAVPPIVCVRQAGKTLGCVLSTLQAFAW